MMALNVKLLRETLAMIEGLNVKLLRETLAAIEANPERHDPRDWVKVSQDSPCGTTMCFAGHAAVLAGAPEPSVDLARQIGGGVNGWYVDGDHVSDWAARQLGLSQDQQLALFIDCGSLGELRAMVDAIIEHPGYGRDDLNEFVAEKLNV